MPIAWDSGHMPHVPPVPFLNVKGRVVVRLLGDPVAVFVHWAFDRTLPCLGRQCPHCLTGNPARWAGYAPALHWLGKDAHGKSRWRTVILYIPEGNQQDFEPPLRGNVYSIDRQPVGSPTPLKVELVERPTMPPEAEAFDVRSRLQRLWRYVGDQQPTSYVDDPAAGGEMAAGGGDGPGSADNSSAGGGRKRGAA